jgi:hypothetical protein
VSAMFYKTLVWKNYCPLPQPTGWDNIVREIPSNAEKVWYVNSNYIHNWTFIYYIRFPHQGKDKENNNQPIDYVESVSYMRKGLIARDNNWINSFLLADPINNRLIIAYGRVYDVCIIYILFKAIVLNLVI